MSKRRDASVDWLRVLATAAILVFHASSPYLPWDWHFSSRDKSEGLMLLATFLLLWSMPLLFVISGYVMVPALSSRPASRFVAERTNRLLIPLVFGILLIAPPQVYVERISRGQFSGSFLDFYPHYFNAPYLSIGGSGNFAWMGLHLWYLLVLWVLSLAALPFLGSLKRLAVAAPASALLAGPALVIGIIELLLGPHGLGGWNMLAYPVYFMAGYALAVREDLDAMLTRSLTVVLMVAVCCSGLLLYDAWNRGFSGSPGQLLVTLRGAAGWCSVLVLLTVARRWLTGAPGSLAIANDLVLPFYILHQTYIVVLAYLLDQVTRTAHLKFALVAALTGLAGIVTYLALLRWNTWLRPLFGLRR